MNKIGLKIMLRYSHFISMAVDSAVARKLIEDFSKPGTLGPHITTPGEWSVKTEDIIGMHTFPLEQMQQQMQSALRQSPGSGVFPPNY